MSHFEFEGTRSDVLAARQTPNTRDINRLSELALQARVSSFFVQDSDLLADNYIASYDVPTELDQTAVEVSIAIRGMKSRFPDITVRIDEFFLIDAKPRDWVSKTDKYVFAQVGLNPRRAHYDCIELSQEFDARKADERFYWQRGSGRWRGARQVTKLDKIWDAEHFTKDKYDRIMGVLGEFSTSRARIGRQT